MTKKNFLRGWKMNCDNCASLMIYDEVLKGFTCKLCGNFYPVKNVYNPKEVKEVKKRDD